MSKLFRLREWLSVSESAEHLSTVFGEAVTEADVLRLGLDRQLTLSVRFVNHVVAKRGRIVRIEHARLRPLDERFAAGLRSAADDPSKPIMVVAGIVIDDNTVLELEPGVVTLDGVFDLPMIGEERLHVQRQYERLTDGPEVTLINIEGPFVQEGLDVFQVQESFDNNEYQRGSQAALERLETLIAARGLSREDADRVLAKHAEERTEFLAKWTSQPREAGYYPADSMPDDSVIVVRTRALRELQERVEVSDQPAKVSPGLRAETTYYNVIGALLHLLLGQTAGRRNSVFESQTDVIQGLLAGEHGGKDGISERTLQQKFANANRSLKD